MDKMKSKWIISNSAQPEALDKKETSLPFSASEKNQSNTKPLQKILIFLV